MKRPKRTKITIETSHQVVDVLDIMVETGLYGTSREACAEELLRRGVREEEVRGLLAARRGKRRI